MAAPAAAAAAGTGFGLAELAQLFSILGPMLPGLTGGGGAQRVETTEQTATPTDTFQFGKRSIGPEGEMEAMLAQLQQMLAQQAMQTASEAMPEGLSLANLAAGILPPEAMARIQEMAFGGMEEAGRLATRSSQESAQRQGVPMGSYQHVMEAELMRPAMIEAARMSAALQQQELQRMGQMRAGALQAQLAVQESPALSRLSNLRAMEGETASLGMQRAGGGLPDWILQILGLQDLVGGFAGLGQPSQGATAAPGGGGGQFRDDYAMVDPQGNSRDINKHVNINYPEMPYSGVNYGTGGARYDITGRKLG